MNINPFLEFTQYTKEDLKESAVILHPKSIHNYWISIDDVGIVFEEWSNFTQLKNPIIDQDWVEYWDSEWYYMSLRLSHNSEARKLIGFVSTGYGLSKKGAYLFEEEIEKNPELRMAHMIETVREKFIRNPDLKELLLNTGERKIIELTHWWDDFFWVKHDTLSGRNGLGKILEYTRTQLNLL